MRKVNYGFKHRQFQIRSSLAVAICLHFTASVQENFMQIAFSFCGFKSFAALRIYPHLFVLKFLELFPVNKHIVI